MKRMLLTAVALVFSFSVFSVEELKNAIKNNDIKKVKSIVEADKQILNKEFEYDGYPLMYASVLNQLDIVKYMLENGAKTDLRKKDGETIITWMVQSMNNLTEGRVKSYAALLEILAANNASFTKSNKDGWGPLLTLSKSNFSSANVPFVLEMVKLLQKHGAKFSEPGNGGCLIELIKMLPVKNKNENEYPGLQALPGFIELGADVNYVNKENGETPLLALLASKIPDEKKGEALKILIENGAKTKVKTKSGKKPKDLIEKNSILKDILDKTKPKKK